MGFLSAGPGATLRGALHSSIFLVFFALSAYGAQTNLLRVGIFPFENLGGQKQFAAWSKEFPDRLQARLDNATPPLVQVYVNEVLKHLTNNAWDGRLPVSSELAAKVTRELRLQKLVAGSFRRDKNGWQVEIRIHDAGSGAQTKVLRLKETSTHQLLLALSEKGCAAFGMTPYAPEVEFARKHPVSNEAFDKVLALSAADKAGGPKEELVRGLRSVLALEPEFARAHGELLDALLKAGKQDEALAEARKLEELAPQMCWGYFGEALCLNDRGDDERRAKAFLKALEVHPGCPSAARFLFPAWISESRWKELKPAAEKAHAALPGEAVSTAALAAVLAAEGDQEGAWKLLKDIGPLEDEPDPRVHATVLMAAVGGKSIGTISRELLWLQRSATNEFVREMVSQLDATFTLSYPAALAPTNPLPRVYSAAELEAELAGRLSPAESALVENPLKLTDAIAAEARSLTAGLTNSTVWAAVVFAYVMEERVRTEQQATNSFDSGPLPVCHQYASRLVTLARTVGLPAWLVHVEFATDELSGYHDRAAIEINRGQVFQFDPSLSILGDPSDRHRILDDVQAIAHHLLQGDDLAKIRIAQKLDPDDPWSRMLVIMKLTQLNRVDEADALWEALEPAFTNRWDYYFSRAQIEQERDRFESALRWLTRAAALSTNNPMIHFALGETYGALNDHSNAAVHLEKAMKLGAARRSPSGKAELAAAIQLSRGLAEAGGMNETQLRQQVAAGNLSAQMMLVKLLFERGETEEGMNLLLDGSKKGDLACQENYGRNLIALSRGARAPEAVVWLRKAALQGSVSSCYWLAKAFYEGEVVPKDVTEAVQWAHVGNARGDKNCHYLLEEIRLLSNSAAFAEGEKRAKEVLSRKGG